MLKLLLENSNRDIFQANECNIYVIVFSRSPEVNFFNLTFSNQSCTHQCPHKVNV